jgi:hypothetical protein
MLNGAAIYSAVSDCVPERFMRAAAPAKEASRHTLRATKPSARSLHSNQAGIVLCSGRVIQIVLEHRKRSRFLEACLAKEFEMPANFESTWLVGPGRPIRLDKVAIHQNAAFRQNFMAARVHVCDRLLPA